MLSAVWNGNIISTEIKAATNYTVSIGLVSGYLECASQSYIANAYNIRNVVFQYRAVGAYIEATDGTLYTSSEWSSVNKTANAVIVLTDPCKVRVALTTINPRMHSNNSDPLENYLTEKDMTSAKADYDGEGETYQFIQFNTAYGTNTTQYAAPYCKNFTFAFPSGQKGHLHSLGQLWTIYQNKTSVEACLTACGGDAFYGGWNQTCTFWGIQNNVRCVWNIGWNSGQVVAGQLTNDNYIHAVTNYEWQ